MNMLSLNPGGGKWSASGGGGLLPGMGPPGGPNGSNLAPGGTAPLGNPPGIPRPGFSGFPLGLNGLKSIPPPLGANGSKSDRPMFGIRAGGKSHKSGVSGCTPGNGLGGILRGSSVGLLLFESLRTVWVSAEVVDLSVIVSIRSLLMLNMSSLCFNIVMNMGVHIKLFLIYIFIKCVFSGKELMEPCNHTDVDCFKKAAAETLLNNICAGLPEYGIKPIDPMLIKKIDYTDPGSDIVMQFENINIEGLKSQQLNDFELNTDHKFVAFNITVNADIAANVLIKLNDVTELISGNYKAKATSVQTVRYPYSLSVGDDGVEHFIIGPETIHCEPVGAPEITLDLQYSNTVAKDSDVVARTTEYLNRVAEIKQKPTCYIIERAYKVFMAQLRALLGSQPKSAFFKDL